MKNFRFDKLSILSEASAKVSRWMSSAEESLVSYFGNAKYLYSRTNVFGHLLSVIRDVSSLFFTYHEDAVTELNVLTAQKETSLRHFAEVSGLTITHAIPSSGAVRLELRPTFFSKFGTRVYIRKYAVLHTTQNNVSYLLDIKDDVYPLNPSVRTYILPVVQGSVKRSEFIADGSKLFMLSLNDNETISTTHIKVWVNNELFNRADSILDMTYDSKSYFIKSGFQEQYQIIFGNGTNGVIPKKGAQITVEYITTLGEAGNISTSSYPEFRIISGVFDGNGDGIDIKEECTVRKELGFMLGSNGDDIDTLRKSIGLNSRSLVLVDNRALEAHLSKYSFLSRVSVWSNTTDRRINNVMVLPNLYDRLDSYQDYYTVNENELIISDDQKDSLVKSMVANENAYLTTELVWVKPKFIKYAVFVYLDYSGSKESIKNHKITLEDIKSALAYLFVENSFSSKIQNANSIPKSIIISKIQEIVGEECRVSCIIASQPNEEAKINGFYYEQDEQGGSIRKEVAPGTDPHIALNERNDIVCRFNADVPILRGGFKMYDKTGAHIEVSSPVTLYVTNGTDWTIV